MRLTVPDTTSATSHRRFLIGAMISAAGLIAAGLGIPALAYLAIPPKPRPRAQWTDAGAVPDLAAQSPVQVVFAQARTDGWKVTTEEASAWVIKDRDGRLTAFSPQCTHLGCAYHWDDQVKEFLCPCHGSRFAIDGRVLAGPAVRPLDRYQIRITGAHLWLGTVENRA